MADSERNEKPEQNEQEGAKKRPGPKLVLCAGLAAVICAAAVFIFTAGEKQSPPEEAVQGTEAPAPRLIEGAPLSGLTALAISPDGKYMLSASASGLVRVWDLYAGKQLQVWKAGDDPVRAAAFSKDSSALAVSAGSKVIAWDRRKREGLFVIEAPAAVIALEYGADGKSLAGISETGETFFWNAGDGKLTGSGSLGLSGYAVLGGGRVLRAEKDGAVLSDAKSGGEIRRYSFAGAEALALQPGGEKAAAAGGGNLTVWEASGAAAGTMPAAENISCLALSADGAKVLYGGGDGSVIMRDAATGKEIARYAGFGETEEEAEWICLTASGYYASSKKGASLFTVNSGDETFTMDQFREALHRSDLVAKALRGETEEAAKAESGENPAAKDGVTLAGLLKEAERMPLIQLIGPAKRTSDKSVETLQVRITDRGQGAGKIMIYNGGLCAGLPGLEEVMTSRREEQGVTVYEASLTVDLKPGLNRIAMSVFGGREHGAPESKKAAVEISTSWKPPVPVETRPALHVFTAAIQNYAKAGEDLNKLKYTKADAEALRKALALQGTTGTRYAKVETYELYDAGVTKEGLGRKFDEIKPGVNENDSFVFFFSGHGDVDEYKDFYFLPADAEGWSVTAERNILKQDLLGNLLKIPAKNIFVMLDTCRSGALEDKTSAIDRAWGDLGQKANLAILMAAAGNQYAIESPDDKQGVLTWTALRGFEGEAAKREGRYVGASELLSYVKQEAPLKAERVVAKVVQAAIQGGPPEGSASVPVGEVATRGMFDTASLAQEPVTKEPEKNFDLFDLKWRPAKITVSALTAGELTVQGEGAGRTVRLAAKKPVTLSVREGEYVFTMRYQAGVAPETINREIYNETEQTLAFTGVAETKPRPVPPVDFVYVAPGVFTMGSPPREEGRSANETQHQVRIRGFFMGKYEVTQKEYAAVMGRNPGGFRGENLPVEQVNWFDAVRYCNERSRREGLTPAYTINGQNVSWNRAANGYRLPTEAEWEYACRAGNTGPFSVSRANFNKNLRQRGNKTNAVGSAGANAWGLYDMHGNVWEWCWDWFGDYRTDFQTDPAGPASGTMRVVRGGGWYTSNEQLRSAYRGSDDPGYKDDSLGFRLARSISENAVEPEVKKTENTVRPELKRIAPASSQIAGTKWSLVYTGPDGYRSYEIEFVNGGRLKSNIAADTTLDNDFWEQSGSKVVFHFNNKYSIYEGQLIADGLIKGTAKNIVGASWGFECAKK
jgi:formylglycine-generating enzyme required for sulfatase activity